MDVRVGVKPGWKDCQHSTKIWLKGFLAFWEWDVLSLIRVNAEQFNHKKYFTPDQNMLKKSLTISRVDSTK